MKNKIGKASILSCILLSSILLTGCTSDDKGKEKGDVPTQEDVLKEVGTIDESLFDKNEEKFFEIAFNMNQLITRTNELVLFYENQLLSKETLESELNHHEQIQKDVDALYETLKESKTLINELEYSKDNKTHDESLRSVIVDLEKGIYEYQASLNYYNSFLVSAFDFETEEEQIKKADEYMKVNEEHRIVLKGHIEKMQKSFEIASQKFVIEIGLFKENYDVNVYSANLEKYFNENLEELEQK